MSVVERMDYRIVSRTRYCEDNGEITEYGIELYDHRSELPAVCCRGISCDFDFVETLLERLRRYRVPPAHFLEIVEDYIEEAYAVEIPNSTGHSEEFVLK